METEFFLLKLDDIRKMIDGARELSEEKIVTVELERALLEIDGTVKAFKGQ